MDDRCALWAGYYAVHADEDATDATVLLEWLRSLRLDPHTFRDLHSLWATGLWTHFDSDPTVFLSSHVFVGALRAAGYTHVATVLDDSHRMARTRRSLNEAHRLTADIRHLHSVHCLRGARPRLVPSPTAAFVHLRPQDRVLVFATSGVHWSLVTAL